MLIVAIIHLLLKHNYIHDVCCQKNTYKIRRKYVVLASAVDWILRCGCGTQKNECRWMQMKGRGLTTLNDWRRPAYITKEKSDVSLEGQDISFW